PFLSQYSRPPGRRVRASGVRFVHSHGLVLDDGGSHRVRSWVASALARERSASMRVRLTIQTGRGVPDRYDLLPDQSVTRARNHATIFHDRGRWFIRDLKTRNGTRVNGVRIDSECPLEDDPEIALGDVRLRFWINPGAEAAVTPSQAADITRLPVPEPVSAD